MTPLLASFVVAIGGLLVMVGASAHRYHSRRFRQHTRALQTVDNTDERAAEIERFHNDRRIDLAVRLMILREFGVLVIIAGFGLWLAWANV